MNKYKNIMHTQVKRDIRVTVQWHARSVPI